jgi:hypothetical protein
MATHTLAPKKTPMIVNHSIASTIVLQNYHQPHAITTKNIILSAGTIFKMKNIIPALTATLFSIGPHKQDTNVYTMHHGT